jgi:PTH1 family peptidyl-tRNA hydrolase
MSLQLIVGLGNPGPEYEKTRHNVGFLLLDDLARQHQVHFSHDSKFLGAIAKINTVHGPVYLLKPMTFMNASGKAVAAVAHFYKIAAAKILVVHDELDLPVGKIKFKEKGGHGGHNGLRDIHAQLGTPDYWRLRIGIDHPGDKNKVADYVLKPPRKEEWPLLDDAMHRALPCIQLAMAGELTQAMKQLHTP